MTTNLGIFLSFDKAVNDVVRFHQRCDCARWVNRIIIHAWSTLKVGHIVDENLQIFIQYSNKPNQRVFFKQQYNNYIYVCIYIYTDE